MSNLDKYTVEELDLENKELKARVNHLESAMKQDIHKTGDNFRLQSALDESPSQSLADIKADAIDELIKEKAYSASIDGIATLVIDADGAITYADKLRSKS